jgi:hypothetical protein
MVALCRLMKKCGVCRWYMVEDNLRVKNSLSEQLFSILGHFKSIGENNAY